MLSLSEKNGAQDMLLTIQKPSEWINMFEAMDGARTQKWECLPFLSAGPWGNQTIRSDGA